MTDQPEDADLETRLRTLLAVKAGEVRPALGGPELRRLSSGSATGVRRIAAAVGAAAAVVVVALATQHLGGSRAPQRGPAGHPDPTPSISTSVPPSTPSTQAHPPRRSATVSQLPTPTPRGSPTPSGSRPAVSPTSVRSGTGTPASPTTASLSSAASTPP